MRLLVSLLSSVRPRVSRANLRCRQTLPTAQQDKRESPAAVPRCCCSPPIAGSRISAVPADAAPCHGGWLPSCISPAVVDDTSASLENAAVKGTTAAASPLLQTSREAYQRPLNSCAASFWRQARLVCFNAAVSVFSTKTAACVRVKHDCTETWKRAMNKRRKRGPRKRAADIRRSGTQLCPRQQQQREQLKQQQQQQQRSLDVSTNEQDRPQQGENCLDASGGDTRHEQNAGTESTAAAVAATAAAAAMSVATAASPTAAFELTLTPTLATPAASSGTWAAPVGAAPQTEAGAAEFTLWAPEEQRPQRQQQGEVAQRDKQHQTKRRQKIRRRTLVHPQFEVRLDLQQGGQQRTSIKHPDQRNSHHQQQHKEKTVQQACGELQMRLQQENDRTQQKQFAVQQGKKDQQLEWQGLEPEQTGEEERAKPKGWGDVCERQHSEANQAEQPLQEGGSHEVQHCGHQQQTLQQLRLQLGRKVSELQRARRQQLTHKQLMQSERTGQQRAAKRQRQERRHRQQVPKQHREKTPQPKGQSRNRKQEHQTSLQRLQQRQLQQQMMPPFQERHKPQVKVHRPTRSHAKRQGRMLCRSSSGKHGRGLRMAPSSGRNDRAAERRLHAFACCSSYFALLALHPQLARQQRMQELHQQQQQQRVRLQKRKMQHLQLQPQVQTQMPQQAQQQQQSRRPRQQQWREQRRSVEALLPENPEVLPCAAEGPIAYGAAKGEAGTVATQQHIPAAGKAAASRLAVHPLLRTVEFPAACAAGGCSTSTVSQVGPAPRKLFSRKRRYEGGEALEQQVKADCKRKKSDKQPLPDANCNSRPKCGRENAETDKNSECAECGAPGAEGAKTRGEICLQQAGEEAGQKRRNSGAEQLSGQIEARQDISLDYQRAEGRGTLHSSAAGAQGGEGDCTVDIRQRCEKEIRQLRLPFIDADGTEERETRSAQGGDEQQNTAECRRKELSPSPRAGEQGNVHRNCQVEEDQVDIWSQHAEEDTPSTRKHDGVVAAVEGKRRSGQGIHLWLLQAKRHPQRNQDAERRRDSKEVESGQREGEGKRDKGAVEDPEFLGEKKRREKSEKEITAINPERDIQPTTDTATAHVGPVGITEIGRKRGDNVERPEGSDGENVHLRQMKDFDTKRLACLGESHQQSRDACRRAGEREKTDVADEGESGRKKVHAGRRADCGAGRKRKNFCRAEPPVRKKLQVRCSERRGEKQDVGEDAVEVRQRIWEENCRQKASHASAGDVEERDVEAVDSERGGEEESHTTSKELYATDKTEEQEARSPHCPSQKTEEASERETDRLNSRAAELENVVSSAFSCQERKASVPFKRSAWWQNLQQAAAEALAFSTSIEESEQLQGEGWPRLMRAK